MNHSISTLENFSHELFYEIFDYLDGIDLLQAFSNLNDRLQRLINNPGLLLKIDISRSSKQETSIHHWKQILNVNKHQIYSITLVGSSDKKGFFTSILLLDSSFDHLQSLRLLDFNLTAIMPILVQLSSLPRLSSLVISVDNVSVNLADIYRLVFNLPMLKSYRFFANKLDLPVSLPMANEQEMTQIENVDINYDCHFHELLTILSYTPQIRRLRFSDDPAGQFNAALFSPISLAYLTFLSIHSSSMTFDQWEIFVHHIQPPLTVLSFVTRSEDINYLDAHRWENFLQKYFPRLEKCTLYYHQDFNENETLPIFPYQSNQFLSTFWIERKWLIDMETDEQGMIFSIRSSKKYWFEGSLPRNVSSSMDLSKSSRLSIAGLYRDGPKQFLIKCIKYVQSIVEVYHLDIWIHELDLKGFIRLVYLFPELDSIETRSIKFNDQMILSNEDRRMFTSVVAKNKITKIFLEKIERMGDFAALPILCPSMIYLMVNQINFENILLHSLYFLEEMNDRLRLLCFHFPLVDEQLIEIFQQIMNEQQLSIDYSIKRFLDYIHVERK